MPKRRSRRWPEIACSRPLPRVPVTPSPESKSVPPPPVSAGRTGGGAAHRRRRGRSASRYGERERQLQP
eukprot:scaffold22568_cov56-Isochrysis_galbana.AAC.1